MDEADANLMPDGFLSLEGGMNAGIAPTLLEGNQVALAVNTTFRGGYPSCRPGWIERELDYEELTAAYGSPPSTTVVDAFTGGTSWFQGAGFFSSPYDTSCLVASIGGRIFRINISDFNTTDITPSTANNPNLRQAWFQQAERWMVIQDDQSFPIIYDGVTTRRSNTSALDVPVGSAMAYGNGRLWVARQRYFVAGDIVGGPNGTLAEDYKDSVLKFVENTYIASGGSFAVPLQSGNITCLKFVAQLDTSLGQGELVIGTANNVFTMNVPWDRDTWKATASPLIRVAQIGFGPTGASGATLVNGDLFYRGKDRAIRSLIMATRDFTQWGNTPISNEMLPVLKDDDRSLLRYCSAATFDNRALFTISPCQTAVGITHRGLSVINFDLISTLKQKLSPCWEGVWTGLNILKLVVAEMDGVDRLFAFTEHSGKIKLWELDLDAKFDDGTTRIEWFYDTRGITWNAPFNLKRLEGGDVFADQIDGQVDFVVKWKPGQSSSWTTWNSWTQCATTETCAKDACDVPKNLVEQSRVRMPLPEPPDGCNANETMPNREFYDAQFRHSIVGHCRMKQFRALVRGVEAPPETPCPAGTCITEEACDESVFDYSL